MTTPVVVAVTLSLASVFTMKDEDAEMSFCRIRWADTDGAPVCPHCGGVDAYDCRRLKGAPRFRCRACVKDFSITSGTVFASNKLPLRCYLAAIAIFCNEVKGKSALALSRDFNVSYKCAFVLLHKLREAMAEELKGRMVGGEGKTVEVDCGYFGGYVKPANLKSERVDRRLAKNQTGKRKAVVIVRERGGNSIPAVFKTEAQAVAFINKRVAKGTTVQADEASGWDALHSRFEMKRMITRGRTASTALAPIGPRSSSAACESMKHVEAVLKLMDPGYNVQRFLYGGGSPINTSSVGRSSEVPWMPSGGLVSPGPWRRPSTPCWPLRALEMPPRRPLGRYGARCKRASTITRARP